MNIFNKLRMKVMNAALTFRPEIDLWIDDERPAPLGWYQVTTVAEAKDVLMNFNVREWSLDHDLGEGGEVYDLLKWMVRMEMEYGLYVWPEHHPTYLTANPVGRQNMMATIKRYSPYNRTEA
jgi:hypothetical protein